MHSKLAILFGVVTLTIAPSYAQLQAQSSKPTPTLQTLGSQPSAASQDVFEKEDWTTIALAKSGLPTDATGAVLLNKTELPQCTRELLRVQWRRGDPIDLYVIRPHEVEKTPVALFLLNYTFDTDIFRDASWCDQAKQNGVAIVGLGSALSPQRFHAPRPMKQWFVSELQEALSTSTHDVQMVLNYLGARGDLDMQRVGIFGQGSGGSIAILAAAADTRITALHVTDPWGDWPDWLKNSPSIPDEERGRYLKSDFLQKLSCLDPVIYLPQLKTKAVRIQQVLTDSVTPKEAKDKIAAAAPREDVIRYSNKEMEKKELSANGISAWLAKKLTASQNVEYSLNH